MVVVVAVGGGGRGAGRRQEVEAHHQGGHGIFNHLPPRAPLARPPCLIADARPSVRVPLPPHLYLGLCGFRGSGEGEGPEQLGREEEGDEAHLFIC